MKPDKNYYITGSKDPKPSSAGTLYVDGTAGDQLRPGLDAELSHWLPNKTQACYKAGTSTEICFKYLEANPSRPYDLVINNHLDGDGVLSVFTLAYPQLALNHKDIICDAAKTSDFWAWSDGKAFMVFQELSRFFTKNKSSPMDLQKAYDSCFSLILDILNGQKQSSEDHKILENQCLNLDQGKMSRQELHPFLVQYHVPYSTSHPDVKGFLEMAAFNEMITDRILFWPQVRNRFDQEKLQLVSVETKKGIHYELWYPGYSWADTHGLWRAPGLIMPNETEGSYKIQWQDLCALTNILNEQEEDKTHWNLFQGLSLFNRQNSRSFPIAVSTVTQDNIDTGSSLSLEIVTQAFKELLSHHIIK